MNADVHAEMNDIVPDRFDASDTNDTDTSDQPSMVEEPVSKKPMMATAEQKHSFDEIFSIDCNVNWRMASKNLDRYRIKEGKKFSTGVTASVSNSVKVSRL